MRKLKKTNTDFEKSAFVFDYLKKKYGESWHLGNTQAMYNRYEEAVQEYERSKAQRA